MEEPEAAVLMSAEPVLAVPELHSEGKQQHEGIAQPLQVDLAGKASEVADSALVQPPCYAADEADSKEQ